MNIKVGGERKFQKTKQESSNSGNPECNSKNCWCNSKIPCNNCYFGKLATSKNNFCLQGCKILVDRMMGETSSIQGTIICSSLHHQVRPYRQSEGKDIARYHGFMVSHADRLFSEPSLQQRGTHLKFYPTSTFSSSSSHNHFGFKPDTRVNLYTSSLSWLQAWIMEKAVTSIWSQKKQPTRIRSFVLCSLCAFRESHRAHLTAAL